MEHTKHHPLRLSPMAPQRPQVPTGERRTNLGPRKGAGEPREKKSFSLPPAFYQPPTMGRGEEGAGTGQPSGMLCHPRSTF